MKHIYRAVSILFAVLVVLIIVLGIVKYAYFEALAEDWIGSFGLMGIFIISFLVDFFPLYVSPHFAMVSAMLFGLDVVWVSFLAATGSFFGSAISFELGSYVRKEIINEITGKKNNDYIKRALNTWGSWFVALATVTPLPYFPIVLGSLHMSRKRFYLFGLLPRAIGIIAFGLILSYIL